MKSLRRKNMNSCSVLRLLVFLAAGHASIAGAQPPGTFTATGAMGTARAAHTATLLHSGQVLIAGGETFRIYDGLGLPLASTELYDPNTGTFSAGGNMTTERWLH